jgi:hypothetical protein
MGEVAKLPQARRYLRAATWGFEKLKSERLIGTGAIFHVLGVIPILRAVPHALMNHDRTLSPENEAAISAWGESTKNWQDIPALRFVIQSRNLILKDADFDSYAVHHESGTGEGDNRIITHESYELVYYVERTDGKIVRRDLGKDVQAAIDWLDGELTKLESILPPRYEPDRSSDDTWDFSDVLSRHALDDEAADAEE